MKGVNLTIKQKESNLSYYILVYLLLVQIKFT